MAQLPRFDHLCLILSLVALGVSGSIWNREQREYTTLTTTNIALETFVPRSVLLPIQKIGSEPAPISASSSIIFDPDTGSILYQKNADQPVPQASLTKLMTALVVIQQYALDDVITIQDEWQAEGNKIKLIPGEQVTVENLLKGLLVFSGNDAALALANHHPESYDGFIRTMNDEARKLQLLQTSYENPVGLDQPSNYSTAHDLAILMKVVLEHPKLAEILGSATADVTSIDQQLHHRLYTTNYLLDRFEGVVAGKTGSTEAAGECLITKNTRNGRSIITVVLGSQDRFADTRALTNWAFSTYEWKLVGL